MGKAHPPWAEAGQEAGFSSKWLLGEGQKRWSMESKSVKEQRRCQEKAL